MAYGKQLDTFAPQTHGRPAILCRAVLEMQAWIDLLLLANFADRVTFIRGNRVTIKRGQVAYSREWFSGRWRWSRGRVERFLSMLENDRKIVQRKSHIISVVTIVNYDFYQKQNAQQTIQQKSDVIT